MSSIVVAGDVSGAISIAAPSAAGSGTLTLPVATDTLVGKATTDTLTNKTLTSATLTSPAISSAVMTTMASSVLTSGTAVASTSGTSIDFTSIPSWVKRITVMLSGVSTNGTVPLLYQIGNGSIVTSGYVSSGSFQGASIGGTTSTAGFLNGAGGAIADTIGGITTLVTLGSNIWVSTSVSAAGSSYSYCGGGSKTLGGTLDRIRITTTNGTDTFDAGSINILYE